MSASGRTYEVRGGVPILLDLEHADPTESELRARIGAERDDAGVEALLALRRDLVGPSFDGVRRFDLTDPEQRRGWLTGPSLDAIEPVLGGHSFRAKDGDPWLVSPVVGVPARDVVAVRTRMRVHAAGVPVEEGTAQLFWLYEDDDDLGEDRSIKFPVRNSPDALEYRVDLSGRLERGDARRILLFRLDPADGPCDVELLDFEIETR